MAGHRAQQRAEWFVTRELDLIRFDRGDLLAAQRVTQHTQFPIGDLRSTTDALLDTKQHLDNHQRG